MINNVEVSLSEREKQKEIYINEKTDLLKLGFTTFYLNRTNRSGSGIIKGGPIGGKNQDSKYLIDCRFNKENLIRRIEKFILKETKSKFIIKTLWFF